MTALPKWTTKKTNAALVLADGTVIEGFGIGAIGAREGEVCFNTALTGYQEILTDPSYTGQIVTFTFPHIGNVGTNDDDGEDLHPEQKFGALGAIFKADVTDPSNYRSTQELDNWLKQRGIIGIYGIDTRALTAHIRQNGMPNAVIAYNPDEELDKNALKQRAQKWHGLEGLDLAKEVTSVQNESWLEARWTWKKDAHIADTTSHIVAIDYGIKRNILRMLVTSGAKVTIVPATTTAKEILELNPDGIFLSNGPGDPAATGVYAVPEIKKLVAANKPIFGICLGHQMLALALGAKTVKMHQGHHGANHPVKDITTGKVEIVSMNHGFTVERETLPKEVEETHVSLFDGTNCGIRLKGKPIFSVQHHPEASPGPQDSHYLFERFMEMVRGLA